MSFYVTTPIYYVNAAPHLGHAYATLAADVLARHMRQRQADVFFLTGTDEHGEPVALAAEREKVTPQELVERNAKRFEEMMPVLQSTNDFFIRTSDERHMAKVQGILTAVKENGHVYEGLYEGWYCPRCADFKTDAEMGPDHTCPIHEIALVQETEDNWFFRLSAFQEPLERLYAERPDFVMPQHHFNEARAFIDQGLADVSLTRAKLRWGVPVPWDQGHVFYVWWDALLNYVTALSFASPTKDLTSRFWPATFHIIGKDILKFHAIYWPALLMAADLELPTHMFVTGFLLQDGRKMSKSLGNVLDPFAIIDRFSADALRHYCFREVTFGRDGSVSTTGFEARYETELANEYGNLASRTLAMIARYRAGVVPSGPLDPVLGADFQALAEEVCELMDAAEISQALDTIWQRVRRLNRYVEERAPWQLVKAEAQDELDAVLCSLAEGLRIVTLLLAPFLPAATTKLLSSMNVADHSLTCAGWDAPGLVRSATPIKPISALFPKVDQPPNSAPA